MTVVSTENAEHYTWGDGCDGWHLVKTPMLSVIKERVPCGRMEVRHYHKRAEQFFFVLEGNASIEIDGEVFELKKQDGIHVKAGVSHQLRNIQDHDLIFVVTSCPPSHGDRVMNA